MTILTSSDQHCRRQTLPRGQSLSPISRDVIGLANRFGSIIVKYQPRGVYGIQITKLEGAKRLSAEWSKFRRHLLVGI